MCESGLITLEAVIREFKFSACRTLVLILQEIGLVKLFIDVFSRYVEQSTGGLVLNVSSVV